MPHGAAIVLDASTTSIKGTPGLRIYNTAALAISSVVPNGGMTQV